MSAFSRRGQITVALMGSAAIIFAAALFIFQHFPDHPVPVERLDYYSHRRALFSLSKVGPAPIVMLGDSLTEEGPWHELTGCPRIVNRGIKGDTTMGVHARLDEVLGLRPRAVFLMIGVNDVMRGIAPVSIAANIRGTLHMLDGSGVPSFLSYILPVTRLYSQKNLNGDIDTLNGLIEQIVMSRPNGVTIDLRPFLRDGSGALREEFSYDGLHLNYKGYQVWRDAIVPIVSELCAE